MSFARFFKVVVALGCVAAAGYLYGRYLLEGGDIRWWLWVPITAIVLVFALAEWHREREPLREERRVRKYWSKPRWAPDPKGVSDQRWWDGTKLTEQRRGRLGIDPGTGDLIHFRDGETLCPKVGFQDKIQYRDALSAQEHAERIRKRTGRALDGYQHKIDRGRGSGCGCYHLTKRKG